MAAEGHPGVPVRALLWFGLEAEGERARPLPVLSAMVAGQLDEHDTERLADALCTGRVRHVFTTETFDAWGWFALYVLPITRVLHVPVTVDVRGDRAAIERVLSLPFAADLTLMVRASESADYLDLLRSRDQLSVGVRFDTISFTVERGVRTRPADFASDTEEP